MSGTSRAGRRRSGSAAIDPKIPYSIRLVPGQKNYALFHPVSGEVSGTRRSSKWKCEAIIEHALAAAESKPAETRRCLNCKCEFDSSGAGNRFCDRCRRSELGFSDA